MPRTHLLVALALFPTIAMAQEAPPPVIEVGGQAFGTWEEYVNSELFRTLGLRCATRTDSTSILQRPASDCDFNSTTIQPEYEPGGGLLYQIPVVVHVIQNTSGQGNISNAMIESQIDVLNEDFLALAGTLGQNGNDAQVHFYLAQFDPNGNPTNGITRTTNNTWFNDSGDYWTSLNWNPTRYLNIYTNTASGALGYVPGLPQGGIVGQTSDRVVVLWSAFGRNAPIGPPFHLGRTATHEVGHYLGLFHTFDGGCGTPCNTAGDRICDTNPESGPVFGCPFSHTSCGALQDPFHNYMDYSDDDCYEEFTSNQVNRMRCTLQNWRPDLHTPPDVCTTSAAAVARNAGSNPDTYTASAPVLGGTLTLNVADFTYNNAVVLGYSLPANHPLSGGRVLLIETTSTRIFRQPIALPIGQVDLPVPADVGLCGLDIATQILMFGGAQPFGLTNAIDLTLGI
jgi:hypothetical protein